MHWLDPRRGEGRRPFVEFARRGDPLGAQVGLGDSLVLVSFVGLAPAREKDPAVEPAFFRLGIYVFIFIYIYIYIYI